MRLVIVLAASLSIVACQGALRKYDGVIGYRSTSMSDGRILISYTDEAHSGWEELEERAAVVCAHDLQRKRQSVSLSNLKKDEFSQRVDMTFLVPLASGSLVNLRDSGGSIVQTVTPTPASNVNQTVERELKLKRLTAECFSKDVAN